MDDPLVGAPREREHEIRLRSPVSDGFWDVSTWQSQGWCTALLRRKGWPQNGCFFKLMGTIRQISSKNCGKKTFKKENDYLTFGIVPICSRQNWIFLSKSLGLVLDLNGRISFFAGPTVNHVKSPCFVGIKIIFFAGSIPLQALASPPRYRVRSRAARGVRNKRCCTSWRTPETWRGTCRTPGRWENSLRLWF